MRLVYLCADVGIPYGSTKGAGVHLRELTAALARHGVETLILVTAQGGNDVETPPGVELAIVPGLDRAAPILDRLESEPERATWIETVLRRFEADALYERFALHSVAGSIAAKSAGIPHLVEVNAALPAEAARYRELEEPLAAFRMERRVIATADVVLVVSRPLVSYVHRRGARKVVVVPNAVDPNHFVPVNIDLTCTRPTAVLLGSLRPWHGVEVVVEAWCLLGTDAPNLLVVGDGSGRELLESVGARVTGRVPYLEVPGWLARAEIGLAPYAAEAPRYFSPLKLFDYLAAGLAVVASALPGVSDVVGSGEAMLVPPGRPDLLAEAVAALAHDPSLRATLGRAARALVEERHTWSHRAQTVLDLIGELTQGHRVSAQSDS